MQICGNSQKLAETCRNSQKLAENGRNSQKLAKTCKHSQKLEKNCRNSHKLAQSCIKSQKFVEIVRNLLILPQQSWSYLDSNYNIGLDQCNIFGFNSRRIGDACHRVILSSLLFLFLEGVS